MSPERTLWILIGCLTAVTIVSRAFFFFVKGQWTLPPAIKSLLPYLSIGALASVVAPEVLLSHTGATELPGITFDARAIGASAGGLWFACRGGMLGTIVVGMGVYLVTAWLTG